ncbi:MAG: GNAT family N-acetyltransferase [Planctomycetota bacterium]|nr:GNAT family N-acetyltransferase [Planctomycetota bacterium]
MTTPAHALISIRPAGPEAPGLCEPILRSVPEWFGIESCTRQYIDETATLPTWIAWRGGVPVGFVSIRRHFPEAAEVSCIAAMKSAHGTGVGTALMREIERVLAAEGVRVLQVKTQGPSLPCEEYALTMRFYRSIGYAPLEELHGVWPGVPMLIMVKQIAAS